MLPDGLQYFTELVVPVLQQRGLFRDEYSGSTLRDNFGLKIPVNRHAQTALESREEREALA
ncbi:Nitrilotriacetate monooxygenase component A [compost metagenome]